MNDVINTDDDSLKALVSMVNNISEYFEKYRVSNAWEVFSWAGEALFFAVRT